jgi:hypothetical protein
MNLKLHFLLLPLILLPSCAPRTKLKLTDSNYISRKDRQKKRTQDRIMARKKVQIEQIIAQHQSKVAKLVKDYAYEARMLAKLDIQKLIESEKQEKLNKELKKIICLKSGGAYYGSSYRPYLRYKQTLEQDMYMINDIISQLDNDDFDSKTSIAIQDQGIILLTQLDRVFDAIYLDNEVVRDAQMSHMNNEIQSLESDNRAKNQKLESLANKIKSLQSDKYILELALKEKSDKPVTVVINNGKSEQMA